MHDLDESPDRRPLVYGIVAVAILIVAAFIFWPPAADEGDLVLTPESQRPIETPTVAGEETASAEGAMVNTATGLETPGDATNPTDPSSTTSAMKTEREIPGATTELPEDDGPATETRIVDNRGSSTPPPPTKKRATSADTGTGAQPALSGDWVLNVGAFGSEANAQKRVRELVQQGVQAHVYETRRKDGSPLFRVRVGYFSTSDAAKTYGEWLKRSQSLDSWAGKR